MEQFAYLAVLAGIVVGSVWLEVVVRTRVLRRTRRLLLTLAPVLAVFWCGTRTPYTNSTGRSTPSV